MNDLLGLLVLSGPLWLIVVLLIVGLWLGVRIAKRFQTPGARIGVGIATVVLVLAVPFADEIVGRLYFNHLCATQAGVKVYQTVELPAEYWDEAGKPIFFNQRGYLNHDFWRKKLDESGSQRHRVSTAFAIDKSTSTVRQRSSQIVLAEITTFRYWGGWIGRNLTPHNTASSCEFIHNADFSRSFYGQLFRPTNSLK